MFKYEILSILFCFMITNCSLPVEQKTIEEKILDSIVIVESASGVLIYQNDKFAFILTAAHVIRNEVTAVPYIVSFIIFENGNAKKIDTEVLEYDFDEKLDLAILKTSPLGNKQISVADFISPDMEPRVGEEIFIASNPNHHYRSLKKGIISSKMRFTEEDVLSWEVDAMIIFGSSGGGAFTKDGNLFGIVSGIDAFETDYCWGIKDNGTEDERCFELPLPNMGYIVPPDTIRHFLRNSDFSYYFKE